MQTRGNITERLYNFEEINTISSTVKEMRKRLVLVECPISKMRRAAAEDDFESFRQEFQNMEDKDVRSLMNLLRKRMENVTEGWNLWEIAPKFDWKNLRENYVTGKIFNLDQIVESLKTGLIGKVIRRGTNYLICVTEEDVMFKSWIRDLKEYTEVKMDRKMRTKDKPNTLEELVVTLRTRTSLLGLKRVIRLTFNQVVSLTKVIQKQKQSRNS